MYQERNIKQLVIDIESKPNLEFKDLYNGKSCPKNIKDPEKIKAWEEKNAEEEDKDRSKEMSVSTDLCEIICVGVKELGGEAKIMTLEEFADFLEQIDLYPWHFITFNGKKFDIPAIMKQGKRKDLKMPYNRLKGMTDRYTKAHTDLMDVLSCNIYGKNESKDFYAKVYLGITPKPIDHYTATDEEKKIHCLEDLEIEEQLFNKFKDII